MLHVSTITTRSLAMPLLLWERLSETLVRLKVSAAVISSLSRMFSSLIVFTSVYNEITVDNHS